MNKDLLIWLNPCQVVINKFIRLGQIQDFARDKVPIASGRHQPYIILKHCEKTSEIKENLVCSGGAWGASLDQP